MAHAASSDAVHFSSVGGSVQQALHSSIVFIICPPMNGVDWHFIVLNGGDGAGCVPASRLLSLVGGGGDHCLLRLSASVKAQWLLALGRCLVVMVWCFSRRAPVEQVCPNSQLFWQVTVT